MNTEGGECTLLCCKSRNKKTLEIWGCHKHGYSQSFLRGCAVMELVGSVQTCRSDLLLSRRYRHFLQNCR